MKRVTVLSIGILICLLCGAGSALAQGKDDLMLRVVLTKGERSRDSSYETTSITLHPDRLIWVRSYGGRRGSTPRVRREFALSAADRQSLIDAANTNQLWVTDTIELEQRAPLTYFKIVVDLTLDAREAAIEISGPRSAVEIKQKPLYQKTLVFLREVFRILNQQDSTVKFEELLHE